MVDLPYLYSRRKDRSRRNYVSRRIAISNEEGVQSGSGIASAIETIALFTPELYILSAQKTNILLHTALIQRGEVLTNFGNFVIRRYL